jgi:uncharacterized protein (TIGR02598 family)
MTFRVPHCRTTAFTLIEVVMAMAVVSFALLAITGLLPVGLQTMRDSQNDQALGTIANQVRGDLQQINFTTDPNNANPQILLSTLVTSNYYYTDEGVKTVSTDPSAFYKASFFVTNAAVNGSAYANGGSVTTPVNAAVVTVQLVYPNPAYTQTNSFSLYATKQVGL